MVDKSETNSSTPKSKKIKLKNIIAKVKRKVLANYKIVRIVLFLLLVLFVVLVIGSLARAFTNPTFLYYKSIANNLIFAPKDSVPSFDGRVNILVLGKGGETHTAGELTDTIIFASIDLEEKNTFLFSLPRDIWSPALRAKLNSAYYWGNQKAVGGGLMLAKSEVENIVGLPVHFALVFDFDSFKEIIDTLGGIEVNVEHAFVDEKFPIAGRENDFCSGDPLFKCRYERLEFKEGLQIMDGETALKFARSRQAEGDEGTDFAREARQQKVIQGVRSAMFDSKLLFDYKKMRSLISIVKSSVETDIKIPQAVTLARKAFATKSQKSFVVPENLLINPPISRAYDFLYVFVPAKKTLGTEADWSDLQNWIGNIINEES